MIFGNLSNVLEGNKTIYEQANDMMPIQQTQMQIREPGHLAKILYKLSHYGMNWTSDVVKNMKAVPADKLMQPKDIGVMTSNLYAGIMDNWKQKPEEDKPFREKTLEQKRDVLRKMAMNPEIEDILDIMANECIVYDDNDVYNTYSSSSLS